MAKKKGVEKVLENTIRHIKRKHLIKTFSLLSIIIISVSIILFLFSNTIVFFAESEMDVVLTLTDNVFRTTHDISKEVNISFSPNNFAWCNAKCKYEIKDLSDNTVIDSNKLILKSNQRIDLTYLLEPDTMVGQKMYYFEVSCNNIKSNKCITSEDPVIESSLIVLNYDLNAKEEKLKEIYREKLLSDFENIKKID